jgi:hypothetical protein
MAKKPSELVTRREVILRVSAMLGGVALVGQGAMLAGCARAPEVAPPPPPPAEPEGLFSNAEIALLDEIAETILPETGTPGAKAAGVGPFMALMVTDCYAPAEQEIFMDGMESIDQQSADLYGVDFSSATPAQRLALLETLDAEQFSLSPPDPEDAPHYFRMMKELALLGYFTSEIGYNQAMRYAETPGRFDPCMPLEPGGKLWAPHA